MDPKPQISISEYATFNNNPIFFNDGKGDLVKIHAGNQAVGYTMINLYSATDVTQGKKQIKVRVPVYEVKVTNESGKSSVFLYTRYNLRANVAKNQVEDRTFDVNGNGGEFDGVVKYRKGFRQNVLELRKPGRQDFNDQKGVMGMIGDKENVERVAIQFHILGASDGCLLAVGQGNLLNGSPAKTNNNSSGDAQAAFIKTVQTYKAEDKLYNCSSDIKVEFDRLHSNAYYEKEKSGSINNTPAVTPNSFAQDIPGVPQKSSGNTTKSPQKTY